MGTLQENQSLNAEYERNKKEREMREEIERLKELCDKYEEEHNTTFETWQKDIKENKKLHSIIKEVREYIEIIVKNTPNSMRKDYANMLLIDYKKVLEILEKENK